MEVAGQGGVSFTTGAVSLVRVTENHETDATGTQGFVGNWRFVVDRAGLPTGFHVATMVFQPSTRRGSSYLDH